VGAGEARALALVEATLEYHPRDSGILTAAVNPVPGQYQVGSLTGAVTSQKVTEVFKGSLSAVGNRTASIRAEGSLTARATARAETKVGPSDPAVEDGIAVDNG
jgi:hypothetical protein